MRETYFCSSIGLMSKARMRKRIGAGTELYLSKKEGAAVVELDQIKYTLSTYEKPLVELRDSL